MSDPSELSRRQPERPRRKWRKWLSGILALSMLLPATLYGGYLLGQRSVPIDIWDPLWLRIYQDRPLDSSDPAAGFWIAGYMVDYDNASINVVKTRATHMDQVVVFGYGFDKEGNLSGRDTTIIRGLTGPKKRILLFGNLTNGAFNKDTAHAILTDKAVQEKAVAAILGKAEIMEAAGVQIDFEDIIPTDRDAYTAFLKRLKSELQPRGLTLSIAAAAKTRDSLTGWGGATDYAAIGQIVDQFYIMTYDEHWRGGEPGPVASLAWTEKVIRYATGVMPAQKILLGIPFYGYEWPVDRSGANKNGRAYGSGRFASRVAEFGGTVKWDPVSGENVATYRTPDGERIAWYPDERSMEAKMKLAYQYNLKGIAIWRLGFEPDVWWNQLGAFRVAPAK